MFLGEINTGIWPSRFGGVSKRWTMKYAHESVGLRSEKGYPQQKLKLQTRLLVREGAPHQQTRNCLNIIKERKGKIGCGSLVGA
jgi:hypothetical protein